MSIPFSDFQKLDLRVGTVTKAEPVQGSEKLVKLEVDLGPTTQTDADRTQTATDKRQIIAGIGKAYTLEELAGKQIVIVANLEPRSLMGLESQGMLLAATDPDGNPILLIPDKKVPPGSPVR